MCRSRLKILALFAIKPMRVSGKLFATEGGSVCSVVAFGFKNPLEGFLRLNKHKIIIN